MDFQPFIDLVKEGGSVLIALAVLGALIYFGYRLVWVPSQRQVRAIAEAHRDAATQSAKAAEHYTEAAKMNMALVWGAIVVAAVTGSVAYALLVALERRLAFWHPSVRSQ